MKLTIERRGVTVTVEPGGNDALGIGQIASAADACISSIRDANKRRNDEQYAERSRVIELLTNPQTTRPL